MKHRWLITGANGFVGRHLMAQLACVGEDALGAVRRISDCEHVVSVGSIDAQTDWTAALYERDIVVHLAARVHVMNDFDPNPLDAYRRVNVDASLRLAEQAIEAGVRRLVYVSSIKVNGESTQAHPFTSSDRAQPADPYSISKFEAEEKLRSFGRDYGLEIVIVRPPLVYGPGVTANFEQMLRLVHSGWPLPLGALQARRSMIYVGNLSSLLLECGMQKAAAGQIFLAADDECLPVSELLKQIFVQFGKDPRLFSVPPQMLKLCLKAIGKSRVASRIVDSLEVDISRTKELLAWTPPFSVKEGLAATVEHFLNELENNAKA